MDVESLARAAGKGVRDLRFSRKNRLTSPSDFRFVFEKPRRLPYKCLLLLARPNLSVLAKLGIIIAKQDVKRAVDRNQLRRIIRESFRQHQEALQGLDLVVRIRSPCQPPHTKADKKAFRNDVDYLWQLLAQ
jgi:ribonuclease P protein component